MPSFSFFVKSCDKIITQKGIKINNNIYGACYLIYTLYIIYAVFAVSVAEADINGYVKKKPVGAVFLCVNRSVFAKNSRRSPVAVRNNQFKAYS